jgi:ribonuclease P protein component
MMVRVRPLKGFEAFSAVFRRGIKFSAGKLSAFFVFVPLPRAEDTGSVLLPEEWTISCGVTTKKGTRPAVLRNRIKRLLRESLRTTFADFPRHSQPNEVGIRVMRSIEMMPQTAIIVWHDIPKHPQRLRQADVQEAVSILYDKILRHCRSAQYPAERSEQEKKNYVARKQSPLPSLSTKQS